MTGKVIFLRLFKNHLALRNNPSATTVKYVQFVLLILSTYSHVSASIFQLLCSVELLCQASVKEVQL